jgi:hypothetical protein
MRSSATLAIALTLLLPSPRAASAQQGHNERECGQTSTIPFARIGMRRLCVLADDPRVHQATGATDAIGLFRTVPPDGLFRLADADLISFTETFYLSLRSIPDSACAAMYPQPGSPSFAQRFMAVASSVDSVTAERWADFLVALVWAGVNKRPRGAQASPAEAATFFRSQMHSLPPDQLRILGALSRHEPLPFREACRVVRLVYAQLASDRRPQAAAALRTLMQGLVPWTPAS